MSLDQLRENVISAAKAYFEEGFKAKPFIPGKTYIPATSKSLDFEDLKTLLQATLDLWLTAGPYTKKFEKLLADKVNSPCPAVFVNSGSSANLLALSSSIQEGDEVITAAAAFPTTVNPILQRGAIPVFVDIDSRTLNCLPENIFKAKSSKTKGVILAHTLGNPFRADLISEWCRKENLFLIEDCCDALGAKLNNQVVGSFGDLSTFSFYPAHHITTGEGGAVACRSSLIRKKIESLRDWGRDCWCETGKDNTCKKRYGWSTESLPEGYDHKYIYSELGYNLKATDLQAALGISQILKLDDFLKVRSHNWSYLEKNIKNSPLLRENYFFVEKTEGSDPAWFGFALYCNPRLKRNKILQFLEKNLIGSRLLFAGNITKQPAFKNQKYIIVEDLKNTDLVMNDLFWIGVHPALSQTHLDYILDILEKAVNAS